MTGSARWTGHATKRFASPAIFVPSSAVELIDHLTARGVMDPKLLYEAPFTDFDSKGVDGVFEHPDVVRLVTILREIEPRTAA